MNKYDGLLIASILDRSGHQKTKSAEDADLIIVNTCSVREHAEQRAKGYIRALSDLKKKKGKKIAVCGCMAQRLSRKLADELPIDYVIGPDCYQLLPGIIETNDRIIATNLDGENYESVIPEHNGSTAMVTVMRGCKNFCSYCIVPYVRGNVRSKALRTVIGESRRAVNKGVKEILLLGQDITAYRDGDIALPQLLEEISLIPDLQRIRFITSHPKGVGKELIDTIRENKKICPHFHLPLQSGSNRILKAMKRNYTIEYYIELIDEIRKAIPEAAVTTDLIVGFPTETEKDYCQTLDVVEKIRFEFVYMFRYSDRPGTKATKIEPKVPESVIKARLEKLIDIQNRITKEKNKDLIGREFEILVEQKGKRGNYLGRTPQNTMVAINDTVEVGQFYSVKIKGLSGWTPIGELSNN